MDDSPSPDDTLPDEAYFDTIAELEALIESTYPQFPVPRAKSKSTKKASASDED